jgi:hypothetical protein
VTHALTGSYTRDVKAVVAPSAVKPKALKAASHAPAGSGGRKRKP